MSLAVRKKSWEEHVTRWTGLPFGSTEHDPKCSHGIVADKLMSNMEKEDCLMVDRKEKCASLPEYLHGEDLEGCHAKLLGSTSREACENGQNEGQEQLLPLETSTETLVHISDEESELSYQSAEDGHLRRDGHSPDGAVPLEEIVSSNVWVSHSSSEVGSVGEDPCSALATEAREEKEKEELEISTENSNGQEIFSDLHSNAAMGTPQERISNASYVMEVRALSDQLLCTADFTQPHSKPSGLKDVQEKAVCDVDPESLLLDVCRDGEGAPSPDTRNDLVMPNLGPGCLLDRIKPENMGYKQPPMLCYKESRSMESFQDFQAKDKPAPHEHGYSLVTLRKRKETRKERDRSRLDSMVLLIMKLDQLDQDIENALTTGTSPTGTPVLKRRHMPDLESGSESGSDIAAVHQSTKTVSPGMDAEQGLQVANCGAKPKAAVTPGTSEKEKAEIEAKEACDWLRAAGFPQYAQLYEDLLFPVDITSVKRDHDFLDKDAIEALCRRLNTLNKCAVMKLEISPHRKRSEDSDEDEPCAISGRWTFQRDSKRWSRLEELDVFPLSQELSTPPSEESSLTNAASRESVLTDLSEQQEVSSIHSAGSCGSPPACRLSNASNTRTNSVISVCSSGNGVANEDSFSSLPSPKELSSFNFNFKSNEKNAKSKTKSLLKRMESLKIKSSHSRKKASSKLGLIISGPVLQEGIDEEKLKQLNCVEISSLNGNHINAPMVRKRSISNSTQTSSSSSQSETSSAISTPSPVTRTRSLSACHKRVGMYLEGFDPFNQSTFSDVLEQNLKNRETLLEDPVFYIPEDHKPGTFPKALSNGNLSPLDSSDAVSWRTGSFHSQGHLSHLRENTVDHSRGGSRFRRHNSCSPKDNRLSVYDNVPGSLLYSSNSDLADLENEDLFPELDDILYHVKGMQRIVNQWSEKFSDEGDSDSALDSVSPCPSSPKQIHLDVDPDRMTPSDLDSTGNSLNESDEHTGLQERRDSGVGASLTRTNRHRLRWHSFQSSHRPSLSTASLQINCQSVAQINLLQKYSLLKLTALLEKYTPSNKHGFSWAVPKFMKRVKVPDYKDRCVFGVPLLVNVRRSGQPLPQSIQQAMRYLRSHCLDQVGLFRKSGVKSRIQALRQMNENSADGVSYEGQSAYDVADMLKQYFRDLPEPVMTSKLSETFLQIYQYVPKDQRLQAIKAAIMLLPDENREVLQTLLYFLSDVAAAVDENQMTPTNLAVCLAPSLFHLNTLKRENSSPRVMQRKQSLGKPDQKDLNENLAATQGLAHMIAECKKLFQIPEEMSKCRNSYMEQDLRPVPLEELGRQNDDPSSDYRSYLQESIDFLLKEVKEKFKGWVSCSTSEPADLAYKKVCDGPPLRLWKTSIEVPATPEDVLNRILKEQHLWDEDLLDSKVIESLDNQTEVYQYVQNSMAPHPARDYVVLRSWRTNLPKGACALLITSVDHDQAPVAGVRVNVLMSRYLIEPSGTAKSKLTNMCRIDLRGHMPEWYHKAFGHFCAAEVVKIRDSFSNQNIESKDAKSR